MRAESFTGQVLAVFSRRAPAFRPPPGEPVSFAEAVFGGRRDGETASGGRSAASLGSRFRRPMVSLDSAPVTGGQGIWLGFFLLGIGEALILGVFGQHSLTVQIVAVVMIGLSQMLLRVGSSSEASERARNESRGSRDDHGDRDRG